MPPRKLPSNEEVIRLYDSGLSTTEIGEMYGCAPVTVYSLLRRIGHRTRTPQEAADLREKTGRAKRVSYWKGKKQPPEMVEKRISKIRGKRHYAWKGGESRRGYRNKVKKESCAHCGSRQSLGIHHINFDHYDNRPENLEVLCVSCHMSKHKTEYWKAKREGRKPKKGNGPVGWIRGGGDER